MCIAIGIGLITIQIAIVFQWTELIQNCIKLMAKPSGYSPLCCSWLDCFGLTLLSLMAQQPQLQVLAVVGRLLSDSRDASLRRKIPSRIVSSLSLRFSVQVLCSSFRSKRFVKVFCPSDSMKFSVQVIC